MSDNIEGNLLVRKLGLRPFGPDEADEKLRKARTMLADGPRR